MKENRSILLGVNIDHIATLRQARGTIYPDPIQAAFIAEQAGADGITIHLREDRRHIQDRDVLVLRETIQTRMNLEMAATDAMVTFALEIKPTYCCLVPERREELTTEGGLDVIKQEEKLKQVCDQLAEANIQVSLFIDPDPAQIDAAVRCHAPLIEIHTGHYTDAKNEIERDRELQRIKAAVAYGKSAGLTINAGHGLNYHNVQAIATIAGIYELNIGHAIIARALFSGLDDAVREMKQLMIGARL